MKQSLYGGIPVESVIVGVILVAIVCKINHDYTGQWIPRNWDTAWKRPWEHQN